MPALWHQPPRIVPNYGTQKKNVATKTNISRVLLHDNVSQQQILDSQLNHLAEENKRATKLMDLHRKSFIVRQSIKQQQLRAIGITHISFLPDLVVKNAIGHTSQYTQQTSQTRPASTPNIGDRSNTGDNKDTVTGDNKGKCDVKRKTGLKLIQNRGITFAGNLKHYKETKDSVTSAMQETRSKSAVLPKDLSTFTTHEYSTVKPINDINNNNTILSLDLNKTDKKTSVFATKGKKSISGKPKGNQATSDPRFTNLEGCLVKTAWPVGGYTQLSPCGNKILREHCDPVFNYDSLRVLIKTLNSPRRFRNDRKRLSQTFSTDNEADAGIQNEAGNEPIKTEDGYDFEKD